VVIKKKLGSYRKSYSLYNKEIRSQRKISEDR